MLVDLVSDRPDLAIALSALGVDHSIEPNSTIGDVCTRSGVQILGLLSRLADHTHLDQTQPSKRATLLKLADELEASIRDEAEIRVPALCLGLERAVARHGGQCPELADVQRLFVALRQELAVIQRTEQQVYLPFVRSLAGRPTLHPDAAGMTLCRLPKIFRSDAIVLDLVSGLQEVTNQWTAPKGADDWYVELCGQLEDLDTSLRRRLTLRNHSLIPRAHALYQQLLTDR